MFAPWPTPCLHRPSSPPSPHCDLNIFRQTHHACSLGHLENTESWRYKHSHLKGIAQEASSAAPFVSLLLQQGQTDPKMPDAFPGTVIARKTGPLRCFTDVTQVNLLLRPLFKMAGFCETGHSSLNQKEFLKTRTKKYLVVYLVYLVVSRTKFVTLTLDK